MQLDQNSNQPQEKSLEQQQLQLQQLPTAINDSPQKQVNANTAGENQIDLLTEADEILQNNKDP